MNSKHSYTKQKKKVIEIMISDWGNSNSLLGRHIHHSKIENRFSSEIHFQGATNKQCHNYNLVENKFQYKYKRLYNHYLLNKNSLYRTAFIIMN